MKKVKKFFKEFFKGFLSIFTNPFKKPKETQENPTIFADLKKLAENYKGEMFIVITGREVNKLTGEQIKFKDSFLNDKKYCLLSEEIILDFSKVFMRFIEDEFKYKSEVSDCDDKAEMFKVLFGFFAMKIKNMEYPFALGILRGKFGNIKTMHELNIFINEYKKVVYIEPQICIIKTPKSTDKIYRRRM